MVVSPLRIERIKKGKTQIDLWVQTDIPQWRISLIERGIPPRAEEAQKLAEALQVSVSELFGAVAAKECVGRSWTCANRPRTSIAPFVGMTTCILSP